MFFCPPNTGEVRFCTAGFASRSYQNVWHLGGEAKGGGRRAAWWPPLCPQQSGVPREEASAWDSEGRAASEPGGGVDARFEHALLT